jgi:CelD/BcsL family acetyltransferase involved in cellulose biosynthesis
MDLVSEFGGMKTAISFTEKYTGSLVIEEINDIEKFRDLKEAWNDLLQKGSDNNIFLTWEWLFIWWQHFGGENKLRIVIIKEAGKIIGIAPLMQKKYRKGFLSVDVLENLCSEECDYSGIILAEKSHEVLTLLGKYVAKVIKDENLIVRMYHIPENSTFLTLLREQYPLFSKSLYLEEKPSSFCSYISLPATWDEYFNTLSPTGRRNIRRATRHLQKDHVVTFTKYSNGDELQERLDLLFQFHLKKWKDSKFNQSEARNFYLDVSKTFIQNNWLEFSFLNIDGKPASLIWAFIYDNTFWGVTNVFDLNYSNYSLGQLHLMNSVENTIQYGLKKYDFLKGDEAYKFHWTDSKTDNFKITITEKSPRGKYRAILLQILVKYGNARARSLRENINLLFKFKNERSPARSNED